jgi:glycosyltransferase involved in cell wall biosynthesis
MNISFLTSGHEPYDDRIFYHMARSFAERGWNIVIVSSKTDLKKIDKGISINSFYGDKLIKREKINHFIDRLSGFDPDIIICSEPLAVIAAWRYAKRQRRRLRIVYDITEWYPSKKNLEGHNFFIKLFLAANLLSFNFLVSAKADAFIFGEWYKSRPYRFLFPNKPFVDITYYPDSKYFNRIEPSLTEKKLRLCYSGRISLEKGFGHFVKVLNGLATEHKELIIEAKIIGWFETQRDEDDCKPLMDRLCEKIVISFYEKQPLKQFIELMCDTDIFLDLRSDDCENSHCLPIKLFYYAALGRPVIFTDLKAIRKEIEIQKFGYLVKPCDTEQIVRIMSMYLIDKELYLNHCSNARNLFEIKYNWEKIKPELLDFIDEISSR